MKKTLLTLAMLLVGLLGAQAQDKLRLYDTMDMVDIINEAAENCEKNGATYNILFNARPVNQNTWNALILPFDIKPGHLQNAFGYAAVSVLVKDNPDPGSIHFANITSGTIPAGTPFLFKPDETTETFQDVTYFKKVGIKKVEAQMVQTDKNGNSIIGVFSPTEIYGTPYYYISQGIWKNAGKFTAEKPVTLKPFRAYIDFKPSRSNVAPRIIIDEPDGTTTVIDAITFNKGEFSTDSRQDNGWYTVTGMRLSEEPTSKGVYIHNSRKVIIK